MKSFDAVLSNCHSFGVFECDVKSIHSLCSCGIRGWERLRTSLRGRIKVERSFVLNVIAEAPLAAHKYASLEDHGVSTSRPVHWVIPLSHCESIRATRLTAR